MNEYALLICAIVVIVGTIVRISIAEAVQPCRPQRITWDDPIEYVPPGR